jgi:predicted phosphoadenosine phosphosulfate sulfurtransferase
VKIYSDQTVLEAARQRIRWVFDEFDNVVAAISGGKDSTVTAHLALEIAREKGRLPLRVMFLDQEAEWQATIDSVRTIMERPDVEPYWMQFPFRLFNATSTQEQWLNCWDPAEEHRWMRPRESYSIKENRFGTDRFKKLFHRMPEVLWPDGNVALLGGVRAAESPARAMSLTSRPKHKWVTWAKHAAKRVWTFYPIYDWETSDVWKAIHQHGWPYCRLYDYQYQYGVPLNKMRVSNVHHETAVWSLFVLQEIEPQTYERLCRRIQGIDMAGKFGDADFFPRTLPPMFRDWREYRDFLLERLIVNPEWRDRFRRKFSDHEKSDWFPHLGDRGYVVHVTSILTNDWEGIKLDNLKMTYSGYDYPGKAVSAESGQDCLT